MKTVLLVVGKTVEKYFIQAIEEYVQRTKHYISFDMEVSPELKSTKSLSEEQQKQALQLLSGCSPEEAIILYKKSCGIKLNRPYRELLLLLIAEHNGVTREVAEELYQAWHFYIQWGGVRHYKIKKIAHRVYLRALEYLRDKGEIPVDHAK